jgi:hypothetical protein
MDASHGRRDHPNLDGGIFWLNRVSDTAAALAGTSEPDEFTKAARTSNQSAVFRGPLVSHELRSLSARRDDSFNPDVPLGSSHIRSNLRFANVSGLLIISALTVLIAQLTAPGIWRQLITDSLRAVQLANSSPLAISIEPTEPRLVVQQSRAARGEPAPLGLTLRGPAEGAVVRITELAPGMELSAGRADGLDGWEVPANDLGYVWIAPPDTFAGSVDVIAELRGPDGKVADRQIITLDWTLPNAPALGHIAESSTLTSVSLKPVQLRDDQNDRTGAALLEQENISQRASGEDEIEPASPISLEPIQLQPDREAVRPEAPIPPLDARWKEIDTASPTLLQVVQLRPDSKEIMPAELPEPRRQKQPNSEELAVLLKRGKDFIATGDLAAARLVLRKAAEANNAEAALALGATYDPLVLRQLKVYGFTSDAAMARSWYEKAAELGSSAASRRLEMLTEVMGTR